MPQQPSPADYNYLLKLLSMLIDKAGGEIRIDARDLHNSEPPKGFSKRWDNEARQLIISIVSHGTALYLVEGGDKWPMSPDNQESQVRIATGTDGSLVAPVLPFKPPSPSKEPNARVVLDDERQAKLELERAKQAALREIAEYVSPGEQRPSQPPSQRPGSPTSPSTPYSRQPQPGSPGTQETFFKP